MLSVYSEGSLYDLEFALVCLAKLCTQNINSDSKYGELRAKCDLNK